MPVVAQAAAATPRAIGSPSKLEQEGTGHGAGHRRAHVRGHFEVVCEGS